MWETGRRDARRVSVDERRAMIVDEVNARSSLRVSDICERFGVSAVTARTDLTQLEHAGKLRRTHGGAASLTRAISVSYPEQRMNLNIEAKRLKMHIMLMDASKVRQPSFMSFASLDDFDAIVMDEDPDGAVQQAIDAAHARTRLITSGSRQLGGAWDELLGSRAVPRAAASSRITGFPHRMTPHMDAPS